MSAPRQFPIMDGPDIPWTVIAPYDHVAKRNHGGQSLERLAARGGLSAVEAIHVLEGLGWFTPRSTEIILMMPEEARAHLLSLVAVSPLGASVEPTDR